MRWLVLLAVICLCGIAPRQASAEDTYAAFSKATGAEGHGFRFHNRSDAEERALQECGRGCSIVAWVSNQCLAFAVGRGNGYGYFMSTDQDAVVEGAIRECNKQTSNCELKSMVCSAF